MNDGKTKTKAILEVMAVFIVTLLVMGLFFASPIGNWERQVLQRFFIAYGVMIAVPLIFLIATRRDLTAYGISLRNFRYHLDIALTCFIPYSAVMALPFVLNLGNELSSNLLDIVFATGVLFIFAWLLRNKPGMGSLVVTGMMAWALPNFSLSLGGTIGKAVSALVFYTFFLGPGEEILFRGYIQSRLNQAFGRPFLFFGTSWGWGVIITSVLFGVFHVLNLPRLYAGQVDLNWWRFTSFFWGLVFGFLREKTGSIVAPAILHGVPQGIAWAFLGL